MSIKFSLILPGELEDIIEAVELEDENYKVHRNNNLVFMDLRLTGERICNLIIKEKPLLIRLIPKVKK